MFSGEASRTARAVAAARAAQDRVPAPYGDPAADERLQRLVAGTAPSVDPAMSRYLRARTLFFDRAVVTALEHGLRQVVIVAAGYDGRALRYAKPGVRWFELDHPATQADKRARVQALGIDTRHIRYVPADFTELDVDDQLLAAGCDPDQQTLVLAEGITVYLAVPVLTALLHALRRCVARDSRLIASFSVTIDSPEQAARRDAFQRSVAALGEPALNALGVDRAESLLIATGWRVVPADPERDEQARRVGFLTAAAVTSAACS